MTYGNKRNSVFKPLLTTEHPVLCPCCLFKGGKKGDSMDKIEKVIMTRINICEVKIKFSM